MMNYKVSKVVAAAMLVLVYAVFVAPIAYAEIGLSPGGQGVMEEACEGEIEDDLMRELCDMAKQYNVIEVKDGGLAPFVPGCLDLYTQPDCPAGTATRYMAGGDQCYWNVDTQAGDSILEYGTENKCRSHVSQAPKLLDCNMLCIQKGYPRGTCVDIDNYCGPGIPSARCECLDTAGD
jgi:hypothetical protein